MFDTATVTIAGNVVADPKITGLPDDAERVNFRVVSTRRRRDQASGEWVDAGEYGVNVVCWRNLARGTAQSLHRGDPVVVIGRITERAFQGQDGARHYFTEVTADFVGHDLAKGADRFYRFSRLNRLEETPEQDDGVAVDPAGQQPVDGDSADRGPGFSEESDGSAGFSDDGAETPEPELSMA